MVGYQNPLELVMLETKEDGEWGTGDWFEEGRCMTEQHGGESLCPCFSDREVSWTRAYSPGQASRCPLHCQQHLRRVLSLDNWYQS